MVSQGFESRAVGQPTEQDTADEAAMRYYEQHERMAPQVSGMTAGELRERITWKQHLLETARPDDETACIWQDEISYMSDLANRLDY